MFRVIHETETVVAIVEWQEGLLHSKTSLVPNVGTLVPLDSQMLPCWRQQSAWAVTAVAFCSDGEHEWMHLQKFRIIVESREVQKMLVTFLDYLQEASWKKCEREIFPLVDQLKLQIALSSLVIAIIFEVCKLVLQWTNEEDMGR